MAEYLDFEYFLNPLPENIGYGIRVVTSLERNHILDNLPTIPNNISSVLLDDDDFTKLTLHDIQNLGQALYEYLFPKHVDEQLTKLVNISRQNNLLRLYFYGHLENLEKKVQFPIELIYSPHEQEFLSALPNIAIFRAKHTPGSFKQLVAASPIRCLVGVEIPKADISCALNEAGFLPKWKTQNLMELTRLQCYKERETVIQRLLPVIIQKQLSARKTRKTGESLTCEKFLLNISNQRPHILHICASIKLQGDEPVIVFDEENQELDIRALANFLRDKPFVRLVIIENTNQLPASNNVLLHDLISARLIQAGTPCILAFTNPGRGKSTKFALRFYQELIENSLGRVDIALSKARNHLFVLDRDAYTSVWPTAYLDSTTNSIFVLPHVVTKLKIYQILVDDPIILEKTDQIARELARELGVQREALRRYSEFTSYKEFDPISIDVLEEVIGPKYPDLFEKFPLVTFFSNLSRFSLSTPILFFLTLATVIFGLVLLGEVISIILLFFNYQLTFIPRTSEFLLLIIFVLYGYTVASVLDRFRREKVKK